MSGGALKGKVAVVTGASRGIGAGIAARFAAEGARVVAVARTLEPDGKLPGSLAETVERIRAAGGECHALRIDLGDAADRARIIPEVLAQFGRVDIVVNNAAWARFGPIWQQQPRHAHLAFEINYFAPLEIAAAAVPVMKGQGAGWILNISSGTSLLPRPAPFDPADRYFEFHQQGSPTLYGSTKAALERMSAGMAAELAGTGVAINTLAPVGAVASEGALEVGGWDERDHLEPVEAMAEAALALCSRPADELSGRIAVSLPLLEELGIPIRALDGQRLHSEQVAA
ncbi:MAG: SDR family NAD(P)-dependent oxidoreductase [Candidatus Sphingomonas colombiensis]|nr:SDR family NAD(P)-dependent oxidoreductase [Sphingomonas sp.]WEK42039.1 MAG: SDR family NAD(P)-dependent oxidoreductase [Sphingomonas sp.]